MPRFIAHIRTANGSNDRMDCDRAELDGNGYLWLTNDPKGQQSHACYAPGAWLSYSLQAPPDDPPTATPGSGQESSAAPLSINIQGSVDSCDFRDVVRRTLVNERSRDSHPYGR